MKQTSKLFWTALLLYAASFFLLSTWSNPPMDGRMPGFLCAFFAFVYPLTEARDVLFRNIRPTLEPLPFLSLLVSGWINPVFALTMFLELSEQHERTASILKTVLLVMMPFTIIFFATFHGEYPREGYFIWLAAMLLALFPRNFSATFARMKTGA
ncbi:MAG: hypothetical protein WBS17_07975 [Candidatus Acidiferrales bacterium]